MKVAVCEFNPTVGALEANADAIIRIYEEIATTRPEIEIVVFPEMAVCGYPIEDLALQTAFVHAVNIQNTRVTHHVLDRQGGPALIVGSILPDSENYDKPDGPIARNVALIVEPDGTVQVVVKHEMANYGVFDEKRTFVPGAVKEGTGIRINGKSVGVLICEDGWHRRVPSAIGRGANNWGGPPEPPELFVWINASPFEFEKRNKRREVAMKNFADFKRPVVYANMCGGQDELVFDGDSFMLTSSEPDTWTPTCTAGERFRSNQIVYFDTEVSCLGPAYVPDATPSIYKAIVLGLRDYMGKQGFKTALIGMSGGVDSALVAAMACDAIGPENVLLVGLPAQWSSTGSVDDARFAAKQLGAFYDAHRIHKIVYEIEDGFFECGDIIDTCNPLSTLAKENIQARVRGLVLMAMSNTDNHLLLTTGNKSEVSVGYSTLYGDMAGGFNPLKDCYKTTVWELCRWRNTLSAEQVRFCGFRGRAGEMIPRQIIDKPPSAELSEGQRDDQSLPPYEVLDPILKMMIEDHLSNDEIVRAQLTTIDFMENEGERADLVDRLRKVRLLVDRAEYKRRQAAPGIKITSKLHGRDRRVPITNLWHG